MDIKYLTFGGLFLVGIAMAAPGKAADVTGMEGVLYGVESENIAIILS